MKMKLPVQRNFLLVLVCVFLQYLIFVDCDPTVQCVHTGSGLGEFPKQNFLTWNMELGPFSIGAKKFSNYYTAAQLAGFFDNGFGSEHFFKGANGIEKKECPYSYHNMPKHRQDKYGNSEGDVELCDELDQRAILRINQVKQTDVNGTNHTLTGWLHLEVELKDKKDQIRMIYAQMYDEYYNAVGEFVTDPTEQCQASNPDTYITPTPYQYLPCSAIGSREAKPSQALYMVARVDLKDQAVKNSPIYLPAKELTSAHGVHFTWRMSEYWCSRHTRIIPMIFVLTSENIKIWSKTTNHGRNQNGGLYKVLRKIPKHWLRPIWIGAADIKHPGRGTLECNTPVVDDTTADPSPADASWILKKIPFLVTHEYYHHKNLYVVLQHGYATFAGSRTCQVNPFPLAHGARSSPAFGGRCKKAGTNDTSSGYFQKCNTDPSAPEFEGIEGPFQTYGNYVINLQVSRNASCVPCRAPLTAQDAVNISEFKVDSVTRPPPIIATEGPLVVTRTNDSVVIFWRGRKFHGILCIIVSMFLMPVSLFAARYYKETFMKWQCKGGHLWYWVHLATSMASIAILFSSQTALSQSIETWGRSQDTFGVIHFILGWVSHTVFIILFIMGGIRATSVTVRKALMTTHSVVGFTHYAVNLFLIWVSTNIPASPSLGECGVDGLPTGFSPAAAVLVGWVACDITFHGVLTFLLFTTDVKFGIKRWYCPIVPLMHPGSHSDIQRSLHSWINPHNQPKTSGGGVYCGRIVLQVSYWMLKSCTSPLQETSTPKLWLILVI
ncbi:unnamed protein product [Orchesella dallaii]|uniref:Ferric-chelate reductase 1 n=1 Tax=Orchesella dallaii TaxID=48710 RepID=A0ABP1QJD6_9HEXA